MVKFIQTLMFIKILILTSSCASDGYYKQQARNKIIELSPEERDECMQWIVVKSANKENIGKPSCSIYKEPTPEELEMLKDKASWKYKIRTLYYGL